MEAAFRITLDNDPIMFTQDGRVSVIDAIRAVSSSNHPCVIWEDLKNRYPEILDHCEDHSFTEGPAPVVDSEGWDKLWNVLFDYLLDQNLAVENAF